MSKAALKQDNTEAAQAALAASQSGTSDRSPSKSTGTSAVATSVQYDALVEKTSNIIKSFYKNTLGFYWQLGSMVAELTGKPGAYGNRTVEKFSEDLQQRGRVGLKVDALYDAQQVFRGLTAKQLETAQNANMSLRGILKLCTKQIAPERRAEIIEEAAKADGDAVTSSDIQALLDNTPDKSGSGKGSGGSGKGPVNPKQRGDAPDSTEVTLSQAVRTVKNAAGLLTMVESKIKGFPDCVKTICRCDDLDKINAAALQVAEAMEVMSGLVDRWNKICERCSAELGKALSEEDGKGAKAKAKK